MEDIGSHQTPVMSSKYIKNVFTQTLLILDGY